MQVKDVTNMKLWNYYESNGLIKTVALAKKILELKIVKDKQFNIGLHGELCETVLEIILTNYINTNKLDWFFAKGIILKDLNNLKSKFLTEIDFALFTPKKIFVIECKSYNCNKTLNGICTIKRGDNGKSFDVYKQNDMHAKVLYNNFSPFIMSKVKSLKNQEPCQLILFDFSNGSTIDERSVKNKNIMPLTNELNICKTIQLCNKGEEIWDMNYLRRALASINKNQINNTAKHLEYVKSLKH